MILSKTCGFLIVLLIYTTKQIFGYTLSEADKKCADAIKEHFLVVYECQRVKPYCVHALYNFRLSESPENSTFIDVNGEHNIYAEEYYKWLLQFIKLGPHIKAPGEWCIAHGRKRNERFKLKCLEDLRSIFGDQDQTIEEIFRWMYNNLTLDEIHKSEFLQAYMNHVVINFRINDYVHRPPKFCKYYFNKEYPYGKQELAFRGHDESSSSSNQADNRFSANKKCSDAIREHFLVGNEFQKVKPYCVHALYNFRLSETPENSTFIDVNGEHNIYAEEYYKWLLQFIVIGPKMKTPNEYCNYQGRYRNERYRLECKEDLRSIFGDQDQTNEEIFRFMYYNLTLDEIQKSDFLQAYMNHVVFYVTIDDNDHRPPKFCKYYLKKDYTYVYKTRSVGGEIKEDDKKCSDAIKEHFLVKSEYQKVKLYCVHALYNFRLSETPENSTFIDVNGEHNIYAEEYYKWLLQFITMGPKMKSPEKFCDSFGRNRSEKYRLECNEEIKSILGNQNQSKKKLFRWMYYNLTLDEIHTSDFLQAYMKHVTFHLHIDGSDHHPPTFCKSYFNKEQQSLIVLKI